MYQQPKVTLTLLCVVLSPLVLATASVPSLKVALELKLLEWDEAYCECAQSIAAGSIGI